MKNSFDRLVELYEVIDPTINNNPAPIDEHDTEQSTNHTSLVVAQQLIKSATTLVGLLHSSTEDRRVRPDLHQKIVAAKKMVDQIISSYHNNNATTSVGETENPPNDNATPDGQEAPVIAFSNAQG